MAVVAWPQGTDVLARQWDGSTWTAETVIDNLGTAPEDVHAAFGNNTFVPWVVWRQPVAGVMQIFATRYTGGTWQTPVQLSSLSSQALDPQIATNAAGTAAVAVWRQNNGAEMNVYASRWTGSAWSAPVVIDNLPGNTATPHVGMDIVGHAMVVYEQADGGFGSIFASYWDGSSWSTPADIDGISGSVDTPQVSMNSNGDAIAVWQGFGGGEFNMYATRWSGGTWTTPVVLDNQIGSIYEPQISYADSGLAIAIWDQDNAGIHSVYASRWSGAAWSAPELVEAAAASAAGMIKPQVSIDFDGRAMAVWLSSGSVAARRWNGTGWDAIQMLESVADAAGNPQVAMGYGDAYAVWQQSNNDYAMRYALDPTYTITAAASPVAGGTASCTPTTVTSGGSTVCTATPTSGYEFLQWTTSTGNSCYVATCTFTGIDSDTTMTANFIASPTPVNGVCGSANGSATSSAPTGGLCSQGTASAVSGTGPWNWTCTGSNGGSNASCSAPLAATPTYAIAVSSSVGGAASCTPNPVTSGGSATCTANAAPGFVFQGWSGDCTGMSCALSNVTAARSVTAVFAPAAAPVSGTRSVPTLSEWALILLSLITAGGGLYFQQPKRNGSKR